MYENNNPQANYGQAPYQGNYAAAPVITTKEWLITMLIMIIPIVNIVMMFVYAFGSDTNPTKANYFKAALIWAAIGIVISIIIFTFFGFIIGSALSSMNY